MSTASNTKILEILQKRSPEILEDWLGKQRAAASSKTRLLKDSELREQSSQFLTLLSASVRDGNIVDIMTPEWAGVREMLGRLSKMRAQQGFTPSETATFVFSLKQPLFEQLRQELSPEALARELWDTNLLLDKLGLFTTEVFQTSREEIIQRQERELLELSTPVVQLWKSILALPLIGTLDSQRTQVVMESLLDGIVKTESSIAIIDITGVPVVDTLVAQYLLKTVAAARLMGADCLISGIRPQIAQTIVHLGVELGDVTTKASLADALALALTRTGWKIAKT
jgi:rsbT co-antagonist protein RsbR